MNAVLNERKLERYDRQMTHPGFGREKQEILQNSTALVAGIGGLGGPVAHYLAAAGIGRLVLVHAGNLELPDLNRQTLMKNDLVGCARTDMAVETLHDFNPEVEVITHNEWINESNVHKFFEGVDIAIDARHNFPERKLLCKTAIETNTPMIEAAMNGLEGYLFTTMPRKTACLQCVYPDDPPWDPFGFSVFGAVSAMIGSMSALEAIKVLTSYESNLAGKMSYTDFSTLETKQYKLHRRTDCEFCANVK